MSSTAYDLQVPDLKPWRAGNTGVEGVWRFEAAAPGPDAVVTALVHGNELCGAWAVLELLEAGVRPAYGSLTLAFCNLAAFDRFDPSDPDAARFAEEDFNRQWSHDRLRDSSTVERRRAGQLRPFIERSRFLLDLHSMHEPGPPLLLSGPHARNIAFASAMGGGPYIVVDAGHADGVRMRDYGPFGAPDGAQGAGKSVLVECGWHGDRASLVAARDVCARFLALSGVLGAATVDLLLPGWRRPQPAQPQVLEVRGAVVARSERFRFLLPFTSIETVARAGTVIADNDGEPVKTPFDDCVLVMPSRRQARAGVTVVRFARRSPVPVRPMAGDSTT